MRNAHIDVRPGIVKEASSYGAVQRYTDGNNVRFKNGLARKIGGWSSFLSNTGDGAARAIHSWGAIDNTQYMAFATERRVWITAGATIYNITPLRETSTITTGNISADSGDNTITVTDTTHGLQTGDYVVFTEDVTWAGITINDGASFNVTVTDPNTFEFEQSETPTSTATYTPETDLDYEINLFSVTADVGWGEGGWGDDGWGGSGSAFEAVFGHRIWSLHSFGEDLYGCYRGSQIYCWDKTNGLTTRMVALAGGSPAINIAILVTSDRHLVALGSTNIAGDNDSLNVRWADRETTTTWTPASGNTAGEDRIEKGSQLVGYIDVGDFGHLLLTDTSTHVLRPVGLPFVMSLRELDGNSGMIAPNAGAGLDSRAYWMGHNRFFSFDGVVGTMPCEVQDYVFGRLDRDFRGRIFAGTNVQFTEVVWFYPSTSGSGENDSVVGVDLAENGGAGAWWIGDIERSAWLDTNGLSPGFPFGIDNDGAVFQHETEVDADGSALNYSLTGPEIELPAGSEFFTTAKLIPDHTTISGSHMLEVILRDYSQGSTKTKGPYTITGSTTRISLRGRGRSMQLRHSGTTIGNNFVMGRWRFGIPERLMGERE